MHGLEKPMGSAGATVAENSKRVVGSHGRGGPRTSPWPGTRTKTPAFRRSAPSTSPAGGRTLTATPEHVPSHGP